MNDDSGYQALTNLYTLSVDDINVPTLTTQNLFVDNAYIDNDTVTNLIFQSATGTQLNLTNFSTVNFSASTGYIAQIGCQGITGGTGFFTNLRYGSSTGNTGYVNTLLFNSCSGSQGTINILNSNSIRVNRTMQNFTGPQGFYNTAIISDSRVVNNFDLCRNILRFHTPVYQTPNDGISNPQTLINSTVNGIMDSDGNWQLTYYVPANNGTIPNGQPFYIRKRSGFGSVLAIDRTDLNDQLILLGGYSNMLYILIYNAVTSVYEYQGAFQVTGTQIIPTPNQFNSRDNSFTLPTTRGSNNNLITSNGIGGTTWSSNLNINSITVPQGTATAPSISISGDTNTGLFSSGADNLDFSSGGVSRLNVSNAGVFCQDIRVNSGIGGQLAYFQPSSKYLSSYNQLDLPISTATQNALNLKANIANPTFTGIVTYASSTGNTGYVNSLAYQSSTGNFAFCNTLGVREVFSETGNFNIVRASINLQSPLATINQLNSSTGIFSSYLVADNRVVNNYELCRSISRFYVEEYYAGVSSPAYTDPLVFTNNFQNGLIISDSSFQSLVYMPARDGIVIPNGQPVYYNMTATINSSFISNIGTNMPSNLLMPLSFNRTYIFIFNAVTSLYEYQGFVPNFIGSSPEFNSRGNSFMLPLSRPKPNNLLSALSSGVTEWTDDISIRNFASTGANIAFINNTTMTGSNAFIANLNTSDTRLHLGNLAAEVSQSSLAISLGAEAGRTSQSNNCIAIGYRAGNNNQGIGVGSSIAIGGESGQTSQRTNAIALGILCGRTSQRENAISIGYFAGNSNQNSNSIAIGNNAGSNTQSSSSIAIGHNAGSTSQAIQCIAIGLDSGKCNQNSNSISIGMQAGESNQQGTTISIGFQSGQSSQQIGSICIGDRAGQTTQQTQAIAIGTISGGSVQGTGAVAIGYLAGQTRQSQECVAIGWEAGQTSQGNDSIAIGFRAGQTNQHSQTIVMNAGTSALNTLGTGRCYINPVRLVDKTTARRDVYYDPVISELTYSTFQDEIGGPLAIGAIYTTLFTMAGNANYLLSLNTRANDGNYGLFICYQEEGANGLVVALNQNNILIQTVAGSNVQIRTVNGATYNFYYNARRLL